MDYHYKCLDELCRICGNILVTGSYVCKVKDHSELFEKTFHIDVNNDNEDVHPPKCCHKCYAVATTAKKADSIVTYSAIMWKIIQ